MKRLLNNGVFFLLSALGGSAWAHDGSGFLGDSPTATDLHLITCFDDGAGAPGYLQLEVKGGAPVTAPTISAQIQVPDKQIAYNLTDPVNGDIGSSRIVNVPGGTSAYYVTVDKSRAGTASYSFTYHCETNSAQHTGTAIVTLQDQ